MNNPFQKDHKVFPRQYIILVSWLLLALIVVVCLGLLPSHADFAGGVTSGSQNEATVTNSSVTGPLRNVCSRKRVKKLIIHDKNRSKGYTKNFGIELLEASSNGSVSGTAKLYYDSYMGKIHLDCTIPVVIPSTVMDEFYGLLEKSSENLIPGEYRPLIYRSEDNPDRRIEVTGDRCTNAAYFSQSQPGYHWGAIIGSEDYTTPIDTGKVPWDTAIDDDTVTVLHAYQAIEDYLKLSEIPNGEVQCETLHNFRSRRRLSVEEDKDDDEDDDELTYGVKVVYA